MLRVLDVGANQADHAACGEGPRCAPSTCESRCGLRLGVAGRGLLLPGRGLAAAPAGAVLAQVLVDCGDEKHVAERDDGDVSRDQGSHDQLDEHSSLPSTWWMLAASAFVGRTSTSACAASRARSASCAMRLR